MKDIYIVYSEIAPQKGEQLPEDASGAFIEVYVPSTSSNDAEMLARSALSEDKYRVIEIEQTIAFDPNEWDDENDAMQEVRQTAEKAKTTNKILYGQIRYWSEGGKDTI